MLLPIALALAAAPPALADHHVHLLSPALVRDWKSLGVPFSRPDEVYVSPAGLLDPGEGRGEGRVREALLVPMAHLYGNEEFRAGLRLTLEQERERVQAENDHVAAAAARHPGRTVALCAVDFKRPYAQDEMRRCRRELRSAGLKLHLASAGADLTDAAELDRLASIAAWLEGEGMLLLLHFDPRRRGLEVKDVRRFYDRVLAPHPRLQVIVAHLGGSGGYGEWTRSVFTTLAERAPSKKGAAGPPVWFDLSAVLLERESEGVPATTPEEAAMLATDLRRLGLDRVLFGSDYPVFDPLAYARLLQERLDLSEAESRQLLANRAPGLEAAGVRP